jgi:hypothetical protein
MPHLPLQVLQEGLKVGQLVELMNGVVEHFLAKPVDSDNLMVEHVVM